MVEHTQAIRRLLLKNFLSVVDHFLGLALRRLIKANYDELVFFYSLEGVH